MTEAELLARAVALLRAGELVAFPTETVYGLGADAQNPQAVAKIFAAKGRPADHPLIVHLPDASHLAAWAAAVPDTAQALARAFWPGPLTLILKRSAIVPDAVTGGQDTVGVRVPAHPLAQKLLQAFGGGLAAPSANRFGRVSPTTAQHVRDELGAVVPLVLDGGPCAVGIESTIVDVSGPEPVLLRPGMISPQQIEAVIGRPLARGSAAAPRASGMLEAHYAPVTPLQLVSPEALDFALARGVTEGLRLGVLARTRPTGPAAQTFIAAPETCAEYAHDLYAHLRTLDAAGLDAILIETPPDTPEWAPIWDRLRKSAAGAGR